MTPWSLASVRKALRSRAGGDDPFHAGRLEGATTFGDSVAIRVSPDTAGDGQRIFDALADGGAVVMPDERQFWGADYCMCRDRFGINWMVNFDPNDA